MPQVITNQDTIIEAVKQLDLTSELFEEQTANSNTTKTSK